MSIALSLSANNLISGAYSYTWANRPSASDNNKQFIFVTNVGTSGTYFFSNGSRWVPAYSDVTLTTNPTVYSVTGTLSEVELTNITIPGGMMSANGIIEIYSLWTFPSSANTKTCRIRLGGPSGTFAFALGFTANQSTHTYTCIRNANSVSSQKFAATSSSSGVGTAAATISTASVNTANDFLISFMGVLGDSSETLSLAAYHMTYRE